MGKVTEHRHLYQTGIWDQCGNQSKGHLVSQKGGTNSDVLNKGPFIIYVFFVTETNSCLSKTSDVGFSTAAEFVLSFHVFMHLRANPEPCTCSVFMMQFSAAIAH